MRLCDAGNRREADRNGDRQPAKNMSIHNVILPTQHPLRERVPEMWCASDTIMQINRKRKIIRKIRQTFRR